MSHFHRWKYPIQHLDILCGVHRIRHFAKYYFAFTIYPSPVFHCFAFFCSVNCCIWLTSRPHSAILHDDVALQSDEPTFITPPDNPASPSVEIEIPFCKGDTHLFVTRSKCWDLMDFIPVKSFILQHSMYVRLAEFQLFSYLSLTHVPLSINVIYNYGTIF